MRQLRAAGIWARAFAGDGIRISIGSAEANAAIANAVISALLGRPRPCLAPKPPRRPRA